MFCRCIEAATGCSVGHRTLRVEDYGKVAATFIDTHRELAVRVVPRLDVREKAEIYQPDEKRRYYSQLGAYQVMPEELLSMRHVRLLTAVKDLVSRPGVRVNCTLRGEEIINQREVIRFGMTSCQPCAGSSYYRAGQDKLISLPVSASKIYLATPAGH